MATLANIRSNWSSSTGGSGVCKGFCSFNLADPTNTVGDTLNHASITDAGSSAATLSFTTSFAAVAYTAPNANAFVASGISRNFSTAFPL